MFIIVSVAVFNISGNTPVGERREKRSWRLIDKDFENQFIRPSNNKWSYQIIYAK